MSEYSKKLFLLFFSFYISYCICEILNRGFIYKIILTVLFIGSMTALQNIFHIVSITEKRRTKGRKSGADIIRTIAVLFVPLLHFFGLSGYYSIKLSYSYFYAACIRWLALTAVPLFMMLTGYFKHRKRISLSSYEAVIPLILTHIFISSLRIFADYKYHGIKITRDYILSKLLYFEYGWYVKLYMGIILFMPFFNVLYNNLKSRKQKELLIITLSAVCFLPSLTAYIIPQSWLILYVFAYYAIGAYLSEYRIHINKIINLALIILIIMLTSAATIEHCKGTAFDWNFIGLASNSGYSSFPAFAVSVLIFIFFEDIKLPPAPAFVFMAISTVSLEMYLFSQMFDGFIYPYYLDKGWQFDDFMQHIFMITGIVVLLSFIFSYMKKLIFMLPLIMAAFIFNNYGKINKNKPRRKRRRKKMPPDAERSIEKRDDLASLISDSNLYLENLAEQRTKMPKKEQLPHNKEASKK